MLLPAATPSEATLPWWPGVRRELWRASRVKLLVLFLALCWSLGLALGGPSGPQRDSGDLSVVPGHTTEQPHAHVRCPSCR
jgi:hypothetical protein